MYLFICVAVFLSAYMLNSIYISIFYHRGLCHRSVTLTPAMVRFVAATGNWVTGLDPKGWICMHRLHHTHSDTLEDPHSPRNGGILSVFRAQHKSYERVLVGLHRKEAKYLAAVADLDFPVHWLNTKRLWLLPLGLHLAIGIAIGLFSGLWALGFCYTAGLMCHPIQGWLVNSFGHAHGPRNFDTPDDSRNNVWIAYLILGEGYQNNHHAYPASAKFAYKPWEFDLGYWLCLCCEKAGLLTINREMLIPRYTKKRARDKAA